jgi:LL-diaminopimelate aminotransferase
MKMINTCFESLQQNYLFAEVARRTEAFRKAHPDREIIRMGIGDVTLPLAPVVVEAVSAAAAEMGKKETFKGYPDYEGYAFLREAISGYYASFGVQVSPEEILVNDGAKSDCGNIGDIFSRDCTVLVTDPVYPVYVDSNLMAGRKICYASGSAENGFLAMPDKSVHADLIYLCSPNNPTGAAYTLEALRTWVDYALENQAVILYDSAYEAFISNPALPRSIFAVPGARQCAIEFCSLSKTAGFTGLRCGYTVIPHELERDGHRLYDLWYRRQSAKFNGVSYPVQRGAQAVFTPEGQKQIRENLDYYRANARVLTGVLDKLGIFYTGGENSPYIWMRCPEGMDSWTFFDYLLEQAGIVGTPGAGFGAAGEGYFRFTAFSSRENTEKAAEKLYTLLKKGKK